MTNLPGQVVPVGVWNLLESRFRSLSDLAQQLLQSAAVIGQGFDYDILREVSGRSEDETVTGLEELTGVAIVTELLPVSPELRYDFSHEKLRSFVYDKTSPVRRRLLHRRVAQALTNSRNTAPKEQSYIQVAYHYRQAGEPNLAAGYYKLAGDYARSLFANRQALTHYQEALNLGYTDTGWLHETMGDLYTLLGEYQPALHQYLLATPPNGHLARLEYKVGTVYLWRGDWKLAISQFEIASELPDLDKGLEARIYTDWGLALHRLNKDKEALELAQKALGKANSDTDETSQARIYNLLGLLAGHLGEPGLAAEHLEKSLSLSERLCDQALQAASLNNLAWVARTANQFNRAIELTRSALNIVSNLGDRHRQAALLSNLGDLYQAIGQFEKSASLLNNLLRYTRKLALRQALFSRVSGCLPNGNLKGRDKFYATYHKLCLTLLTG